MTMPLTTVLLSLALCPPMPEASATSDVPNFVVDMGSSWAAVRPGYETTGTADDGPALGGKNPSEFGAWTSLQDWDVIAIHSTLLPTGEVLQYSYPAATEGSRARTWNPVTNTFTEVNWADNLFCSGHAQLADGRILVVGGNDDTCGFEGIPDTNIFDPTTHEWAALGDMVDGRWYPTTITLPDGRVLIFTGLDSNCETNPVVEMYTPDVGLTIVPEGEREIGLYARMHILSDGRLAHVGPESGAWTFELGTGWTFVDWNNNGWRSQGTSVLLPGRTDEIMIIGGSSGGVVTATCEIIDFNDAAPEFVDTTPLHNARAHADALILPDQTVMVVGGGTIDLYDGPVFVPELYDPETATWTELAPHGLGRMYHATTVLLPDARVLVAGQDNGDSSYTAEIYSPPYLFQGARPSISTAPTRVSYGVPFSISTPDAAAIDSAVMIKLTSVTHSVNFQQRLVDLDFVSGTGAMTLEMPANPNLMPPGHYMLFAVSNGVPSTAAMIQVGPQAPGDANGDGRVDFNDVLTVLSAWGPCGGCHQDLDHSGAVDFGDLLLVLGNWT